MYIGIYPTHMQLEGCDIRSIFYRVKLVLIQSIFLLDCLRFQNLKKKLSTILFTGKNLRRKMAQMLDCEIRVNEVELQSCYYVHFWTNALEKGMNPFIPIQLWVE